MLSKSKAKFIRSLQLRKYRQKYHKIVVEGVKIVNDLISEELAPVELVVATSDWGLKNGHLVAGGIELVTVEEKTLKELSTLSKPNEVLAVVGFPEHQALLEDCKFALCLYLDGVRDPGNLGTIIRTADWFGISTVFLSPDCVDPYNPKVMQSSMSSIFRVKLGTFEAQELLEIQSQGIVAAAMHGRSMTDLGTMKKGVLVMGNESRGVSEEVLGLATDQVLIPGPSGLGAESLNVAVAAGILCAQFTLDK